MTVDGTARARISFTATTSLDGSRTSTTVTAAAAYGSASSTDGSSRTRAILSRRKSTVAAGVTVRAWPRRRLAKKAAAKSSRSASGSRLRTSGVRAQPPLRRRNHVTSGKSGWTLMSHSRSLRQTIACEDACVLRWGSTRFLPGPWLQTGHQQKSCVREEVDNCAATPESASGLGMSAADRVRSSGTEPPRAGSARALARLRCAGA